MRLPSAKPLAFIVAGLTFIKPGFTNIQFDKMTLVATALVLGSGFNLSRISRMWFEDKGVSTLSYFLSDAKFYVPQLQLLYAKRIQQVYDIRLKKDISLNKQNALATEQKAPIQNQI